MKRLLMLSAFVTFAVLPAAAQLIGDGSLANPWSGTLNGDLTITGTKYFNGNIYVDNEILTVTPGAKVIALLGSATIYILETGQIVASGYSATPITFTSDSDGDGTTGDPDDWWGNITITSSSNNVINYCIFEKGRKNLLRFGFLGGGLRIGTSSLTVSNSLFRSCLAGNGGAIAVTSGASPVISSCSFTGNTAINQGGAFFIEAGSAPLIVNCLFNGNISNSLTLSGSSVASISSAPMIVNSTIVNSSSPSTSSNSLYLENSPGALVVNSVFWGVTTNHIGLNSTPATVLYQNAIEGASFPDNITLNSLNNAPDGPNFVNPAASDFNINFASPMRDNGVQSFPGLTIPTKDINNKKRIYLPDIGAYEAIYSRWTGNIGTSWLTPKNWEGSYLPVNRNIVIPGGMLNYPTDIPGPAFTLATGLQMIMESGAKATFASLSNSGTIDLRADATGYASLITGSYSGAAGNINVDLHLTSGPTGEWWHYIAAPATVSKTVFTDIEPDLLARYDETKVITDIVDGWQWHDGYNGTTPFSNLTAKEGYDVSVAADVTMTFRNLKSLTTSMGRIDLPFSGSGGDTTIHGYSLLGNSLTCGINWDLVTYSHDNSILRHAYYIRTSTGEEASYVDGVGTNGATAHIAPLQGFFVRTRATGTYITIPDNAREHNDSPRFKSAEQIPLVRLIISSAASKDEMVIRFDPEASFGFDGLLDAGKPFSHLTGRLKIYSVLRGENYSINAIPWPSHKTSIPLTLEIPEAGTYSINRSQLQNIGDYRVVLTDNLAGKKTDLSTTAEYIFSVPGGTITGRFTLDIIPAKKKTAAVTEEEKPGITLENSLRIYSAAGKVCILPQGSDWNGVSGQVRIFNITGRIILASEDERFNSGELKEYYPGDAGSLLIVEVTAGPKRYLGKVVLAR